MLASRVYTLFSRPQALRSKCATLTQIGNLSTEEATQKKKTLFPYAKNQSQHDSFNISGTYSNHFDHKVVNHSFTHGPTGSYITLSESDARLIPEGFAGEAKEEFQVAKDKQKRWMIRDAAKLCCRLIDQYKFEKTGEEIHAVNLNTKKVEFPGLTNRPEWHDSVMSVEHFGKELTGKPKISFKASGKMHIDQPEENIVDLSMAKIKETGHKVDRILLAGPRGVGKSFALNHAVLHARKSGWLVLFINNGWAQAQLGSYVQPALMENQDSTLQFHTASELKGDELEDFSPPPLPVTDDNTVFDNHEMSADVLRGFWRAHAEQLRDIPIRDVSIMKKYASYRKDFESAIERIASVEEKWKTLPFITLRKLVENEDNFPEIDKMDEDVLANFNYHDFEAKNLEDLILLGVALRELSGSLFIDLMNELKVLDDPNYPIMIAVDQYNAWEGPSGYSFNNQQIAAKKLCVPYALNFLSTRKDGSADWSLKNGICVATTCLRFAETYHLSYKQNKPSIPLAITVPHYNAVEYLAAASYLMHSDWLAENVQMHEFLAMRSFTGSNPRLLRLQGASYLLPRMIESNAQAIEEQLDREEREAARLKKLKESGDYFDESELTAFADGGDDDDDASAIRRRFDDDGDEEVIVEEESEDEDAMVKLGFPELKTDIDEFDDFDNPSPVEKVKSATAKKGAKKGGAPPRKKGGKR
eukprot:CAMPEP_0170364790 /NCGR_PEP_ID=MMETSP0117_2-20130122/5564_1 /TAXON_ID=400756 /ORGANISM="Durinskia baltica, Strain CSIRO CS-38" /LENGTH=700 /DNA_ID=CAMNT_0010619319 /DNA_START=113 /DNA_END=2215 /DNA_ORIENTATION=+